MFKCQICKYQSEHNESQFILITEKRKRMYNNLDSKGWEIKAIKKVCHACWEKNKDTKIEANGN